MIIHKILQVNQIFATYVRLEQKKSEIESNTHIWHFLMTQQNILMIILLFLDK